MFSPNIQFAYPRPGGFTSVCSQSFPGRETDVNVSPESTKAATMPAP
jgi:hypothetical protein